MPPSPSARLIAAMARGLAGRQELPHGTARGRGPEHTCPACLSDAVALARWREQGPDHWWLLLRCGECGRWREPVLTQDEAEDFEHELDAGLGAIARALRRLDRQRLEAEVELFAAALERDLIDAADFA